VLLAVARRNDAIRRSAQGTSTVLPAANMDR
jgi:hypothetical protein